MNLPTGVVKVSSRNVRSFEAKRELDELSQSNFSGYVIESLFGLFGLEESCLLFKNGAGTGAIYEYYGIKTTLQGDEAVLHVLNAFSAEHGVLDLVELTSQQADLVTAFNAKLKLSKPIQKGQFRGLVKEQFDSSLGQGVAKQAKPEAEATKESLFKRFGLAGIDH